MQNVIDTIKKKQKQFTEMQECMIKATSKSLNINKKKNKYNKIQCNTLIEKLLKRILKNRLAYQEKII